MNVNEVFLSTLKKYNMIEKGDKIIVGVSGGPDSVCLLHLLATLQRELDIYVYAAHLDHMIRGDESRQDAQFVEKLCRAWDIKLFTERFDVPSYASAEGLSMEDAARRVRYDFFKRVRSEIKADKIATGHNRDDHEETILMNILRGSGLEGLLGIEPVQNFYIRPLIEIPREEIEKYLNQNNILFRIDSTNLTTDYFRNSIRLELIPLIEKKYCPHLGKSLRRLSEIARRDLSFILEEAQKASRDVLDFEPFCVIINIGKFSNLHEAIKYHVARFAIEKIAGDTKGFEEKHTALLVKFIEESETGKMIDLPKGIRGIKEYGRLVLYFKSEDTNKSNYAYELSVPGKVAIPESGVTIESDIIPHDSNFKITVDLNIAYLDFDKVGNFNLIVRNRRAGDKFKPLGADGFKKIKEFFIDEKIPQKKRNKIPIVESCSDIIWVAGMRIDDRFKVDDETKKVLVLKMKGNFDKLDIEGALW